MAIWRSLGRRFSRLIIPAVIFTCFLFLWNPSVISGTDKDSNPDDLHIGVQVGVGEKRPQKVPNVGGKRRAFEGVKLTHDPNGPGENGAHVPMTEEENVRKKEVMKKWFMNVIASDKISLDRRIPDTRETQCKEMLFDADLPSVSVVIIFHNEAWSPLIRTVHSVVNRSPPDLLHEVVLLDDASDRDELQSKLTDYVKRWNGLVRLVRVKERQGLIRARIRGAEAAKGDIMVFLDSHCEANVGFLEPLAQRIKDQPNSVLVPAIDMISDDTMSYWGGPTSSVGGFWWSLHFKWDPIPDSEKKRRKSAVDPIRSPTMPGGLFAIGRKYFWDLGGYDPGMDIWGGENLEISFRTWMCGGVLEFIPCSHVGHIFRSGHPYNMTTKDVHGLNSKRLAEVWMDDYKRLFYHHRQDLRKADAGDFSDRIALRKKLKCKSFKWFLENVNPDKFIPDENVFAFGSVKNPTTGFCLDTMQRNEKTVMKVGIFHCQGGGSSAQMFSFSKKNMLRREESCMDLAAHDADGAKPVKLYPCGETVSTESMKMRWVVPDPKGGPIKHERTGLCLDTKDLSNGADIVGRDCDGSDRQHWVFEHVV